MTQKEIVYVADITVINENDEYDEEDEENTDEIVRAKWTIDGAKTLAEAADMAHEFGIYLQTLHDQGYVLRQPIEDDYGFYYKSKPPTN
jgi:hypothetical protein